MILRTYFFVVVVCLALASCADRVVCPAYQSTFIHDKETLRRKFSYFENDSVPKVYTASKTKYLIAVPESYRKRYRKMQTVDMKPVYQDKAILDSLEQDQEQDSTAVNPLDSLKGLDSTAMAGLDSATRAKIEQANKAGVVDSVYVITKDKEVRILRYNEPDSTGYKPPIGKYFPDRKPIYYIDEVGYNSEQENYMWYFRKELILPDVRLSKVKSAEKAEAAKEGGKKKKGFFRKLMFWKKDKPKSDSLQIAPVNNINPEDSLDFNMGDNIEGDSAAVKTPPAETKPKKKGLKGLFKKKDQPATDPKKQPAKKEEDGF
jgi:hypothetical protein